MDGELAAAISALADGRWSEARMLCERVLETTADPAERARAAAGLSDAHWWLGQASDALRARRVAYEAWREARDDEAAVVVALWLAREYLGALGNEPAAHGWVRRAETLAGDPPMPQVAGWIALARSTLENDPEARLARVEDALARARQQRDGDLEALALARRGLNELIEGRLAESVSCFDEAMAMGTGGETSLETLGTVCCDLSLAAELWGNLEPFARWADVVMRVAQERGHPPLVSFCSTCCAEVFTAGGDWKGAEAQLRHALAMLGATEHHARCVPPTARLAELMIKQGRLEEAEQLLGEDDSDATLVARGRLALARGNPSAAVSLLERAHRRGGGDSLLTVVAMALLVEGYVATHRLGEARELATRIAALASSSGNRTIAGRGALALARAQEAAGDRQGAATAAEAALDHLAAVAPGAVEVAEAHLVLARVRSADAPEAALPEARAAVAAFERAGATARCDEAAALARALGDRTRVGAKGLGELTQRERQVLELVALGLTNAELAQRLFISPKTAENHVSNILTKLNLRSRTEAAAYALSHPPA